MEIHLRATIAGDDGCHRAAAQGSHHIDQGSANYGGRIQAASPTGSPSSGGGFTQMNTASVF